MRFSLKPIIGLLSRAADLRQARRPTSRRRSPMALKMLETRNLLSIAGVTLSYGNLAIHAPTGSQGNVATVSIDPGGNGLRLLIACLARSEVQTKNARGAFGPSCVGCLSYGTGKIA